MKISALVLRVTATAATALTALPVHGQPVSHYLERIAALDDGGPMLGAVIAINPDALKDEAASRTIDGPLSGKAMLIKDNIEVAGTLRAPKPAFCAGSHALPYPDMPWYASGIAIA